MANISDLFKSSGDDAWARHPDHVRERIDRKSSKRGCWIWTGKKAGSGQAMYFIGNNKSVIAYRHVYKLVNGTLPELLRHTCDDRACVNPAHLLPGSAKQNNEDASRRNRVKRKLTDKEVREIMYLIDRGDRMVDIAPHYGVSPELVGQIKSRKRYSWMHWRPLKP